MQQLIANQLPPRLTEFRTITNTFAAGFTLRASILAQMHGYPSPTNVAAYALQVLNISNLTDLKSGLLRLRNIAFFAASIADNLSLVKMEKYQMELGTFLDFVRTHKGDYGYRDMSEDDQQFVAYFVTGSEIPDSSWALDLQVESTANLFIRLLKLYKEVADAALPRKPVFNAATKKIDLGDNGKSAKYFSPLQDALVSLTEMITPPSSLLSMSAELKTLATQAEIDSRLAQLHLQISNETQLFRLADLRLIDHVMQLFTHPKIWGSFLPARNKPDSSQNLERAKGLRLLAGYCQSLLLMPHIMRYEIFKQGFEDLENWHGSTPVIPAHILANYVKFVSTYDIFHVKADVSDLFQKYAINKDPNLNSKIYVQFKEVTTLYGIDDLYIGYLNSLPELSTITIDKLSDLDLPANSNLLLRLPLAQFALLDDLHVRLVERARFEVVSEAMFGVLLPGANKYFNDETLTRLGAMKLTADIPWHGQIPTSHSFDRGINPEITLGTYPMRFLAPWATSANEHALRTTEAYKISSAYSLSEKYTWKLSYDEYMGQRLRTSLNRQWQGAYPDSVIKGMTLLEVGAHKPGETEIRRLFEAMTGSSFDMLRRALFNEPLLEIWATYLSSGVLLYRKMGPASAAILIEGKFNPYGLTYKALETLQKFEDADLISIPGTQLSIAPLKVVPVPSADLSVGIGMLSEPYYYYTGNGGTLPVKRLVLAPGLLHMGFRPVRDLPSETLPLLDKQWIYQNDSLFIQLAPDASYNTNLDNDEVVKVPLREENWPGDKTAAHIRYMVIGSYGPDAPLAPADNDLSKTVNELAKEIDKEATRVEKESTVLNVSGAPTVVTETDIVKGVEKIKAQ